MTSGAALTRKYRKLSAANLLVVLVMGIVAAWVSGNIAADLVQERLRANARETLFVQAEVLAGLLDKYRLLPAMLARRNDLPDLFTKTPGPETLQSARRIALHVVGLSGAMDISFIYPDGKPLATGIGFFSDRIEPESPLFIAAVQGRLGREMRVLDNGKRAYVFTTGVRDATGFVGVVAVYVSLEQLEASWSLTDNPVLAVDKNHTIVMSNRENLRLRRTDDIEMPRGAGKFVEIVGENTQYLEISRPLPLLGWQLRVLADIAPSMGYRTLWGSLSAVACALIALAVQALIHHQYTIDRRKRLDRATSLRLERMVRDRTRALIETNTTLEHEIEERRAANMQLRQTQNELIQTGKLAALGQMSTALSHEYNQPLSAIKSYANNALTYMDRGREDEARNNIKRISDLTDRMAQISKHLRNFARKPNPTYSTVPVSTVIDDALSVLTSRIHADNAEIVVSAAGPDIWARAGYVRLQQVIVNLVLNALDAMQGQNTSRVTIHTACDNGKVMIRVTDTGPGLAPDTLTTVFDPFFTTKEVGKGLGLGLSISYNIIKDFEGQLTAANTPEGGAEFTITLDQGEQSKAAAE